MGKRIMLFALLLLFRGGVASGQPPAELEDDRYGKVTVGMGVAEAERALGAPFRREMEPEEPGGCYYVVHGEGDDRVAFMVIGERITRIDVWHRETTSAPGGIRVGDDEAAVYRQFGKRVSERSHPYIPETGKYLTVETRPGFGFIFETDGGKITSFRSGRMEQVRYIEGCL